MMQITSVPTIADIPLGIPFDVFKGSQADCESAMYRKYPWYKTHSEPSEALYCEQDHTLRVPADYPRRMEE